MIDVQNLNVTFGRGKNELHAVRDVSFHIAQGESFGLVGESGSGKSTVLRAISRLIRDWTGTIKLNGTKLGYRRDKATARRMQMVFQDPYGSLHPRHTINDILMEPLEIHHIDRREERVRRALSEVGLEIGLRFRYPYQISGGQRQRIAIARAVLADPKILLLDEATSALDNHSQAVVTSSLRNLKSTRIVIAHRLSTVIKADRIIVLQDGHIVQNGSYKELIAVPGLFQDLATRQIA